MRNETRPRSRVGGFVVGNVVVVVVDEGQDFGLASALGGEAGVGARALLGDHEKVGEMGGEAAGFEVGEVLAVAKLAESHGATGALEGAGDFLQEAEVGEVVEVGNKVFVLVGEPAGDGNGVRGGLGSERGFTGGVALTTGDGGQVQEEGETPGGIRVVDEERALERIGGSAEGAADFIFVGAEDAAGFRGDGKFHREVTSRADGAFRRPRVIAALFEVGAEEMADGLGPIVFEGFGNDGESVGDLGGWRDGEGFGEIGGGHRRDGDATCLRASFG